MRTSPASSALLAARGVPLLDASFLPAEEDWAVVGALNADDDRFDANDDHYADLGFLAGAFD